MPPYFTYIPGLSFISTISTEEMPFSKDRSLVGDPIFTHEEPLNFLTSRCPPVSRYVA